MVPAFTRAKPRQRGKPCRRVGGGKCKAIIMKGVVKYLHQQPVGVSSGLLSEAGNCRGTGASC